MYKIIKYKIIPIDGNENRRIDISEYIAGKYYLTEEVTYTFENTSLEDVISILNVSRDDERKIANFNKSFILFEYFLIKCSNNENLKCTCDIISLQRSGCKCGAMQREKASKKAKV